MAGEETLLGLAIEHVADTAAEKLGLKQGSQLFIGNIYWLASWMKQCSSQEHV